VSDDDIFSARDPRGRSWTLGYGPSGRESSMLLLSHRPRYTLPGSDPSWNPCDGERERPLIDRASVAELGA